MKKTSLILIVVLIGVGGFFAYDAKLHEKVFNHFVSGDLAVLKKQSLSFMEDIQFKDFKKAASYHSPEDRKKVNIPKLIERMFKVKPEQLDIMEYEILEKSLDSSGKRGRVKIMAKVNILNTGKIKKPEVILYYHKKGDRWFMELESSLRR
jgi:uncharacterized protein YxeA